ncbi:MAG: hypothetical protein A4E65_02022 [Syntrophorhabdus sp. PtaU1.Bin153]|nr:MAG: hypothetical protein A4E65_02022 [Syntrophorhabdus sp. PtaU1.Bin153]
MRTSSLLLIGNRCHRCSLNLITSGVFDKTGRAAQFRGAMGYVRVLPGLTSCAIMKQMGKGHKEPLLPIERRETIRKYISAVLQEHTLSAKDMSIYLRIPEKDVYEHLEHIRRTMNKGNYRLVVVPAQCERCGFVFRKRGRLSRPGKCPMCHSSLILPPLFVIHSAVRGEAGEN